MNIDVTGLLTNALSTGLSSGVLKTNVPWIDRMMKGASIGMSEGSAGGSLGGPVGAGWGACWSQGA